MWFVKAALLAVLSAPSVWSQQAQSVNLVSSTTGSYLGIWVWQVDDARARELKLPETSGVEVTLVQPGSPAEAAGLKLGDVIADYNGQTVQGIEHFSRLVRETAPGRIIKLRIFRNGAAQVLTARVGAISSADRPGPIVGPRPDGLPQTERQDVPRSLMTWRSPVLGVDAEPLFGQLAAYFGVSEGVLVRSVVQGSPAEKAGLKAGDVITKIGKSAVSTPAEITAQLRVSASANVRVTILRNRAEMAFSVTLE